MQLSQLIDRYCAAWSAENAQRRRELLLSIWREGATYTDPTVHAAIADELLTHITNIHTKYPGVRIVRTSDVDAHHDIARFHWRFLTSNGIRFPDGLDIAFLNDQQTQITKVVGFFGSNINSVVGD